MLLNFFLSRSQPKRTMNKKETHNLRLMRSYLAKHGEKDAHGFSYENCLDRIIHLQKSRFQ